MEEEEEKSKREEEERVSFQSFVCAAEIRKSSG